MQKFMAARLDTSVGQSDSSITKEISCAQQIFSETWDKFAIGFREIHYSPSLLRGGITLLLP